jgi:predicted TIM-barrel enzyme
MDVGHQKTKRKILDLNSRKVGIGLSTQKETITTLEAATPAEGKAEAEAKIDIYIVSSERYKSYDNGLFHLLRIQEENDPSA